MKGASPSSPLTDEEGDLLVAMARREVRAAADGVASPPGPSPFPGAFASPRDVFVTLTLDGRLRGCLGTWKAGGSLLENLLRAARGAALDDPRFPRVDPREVARLAIEVTVLDAPFRIDGPGGLLIGRHGVSVSHRLGRGLLLPQVGIEQQCGPEEFLGLVCRKAGLAPEAWRSGAILEAFSARVFRERGAGKT